MKFVLITFFPDRSRERFALSNFSLVWMKTPFPVINLYKYEAVGKLLRHLLLFRRKNINSKKKNHRLSSLNMYLLSQ